MPTPIPIPPAASQAEEAPQNPEFQIPFAARIPRGQRDRWTPYKAGRGLATVFKPELVTEIYEAIQCFGFTDDQAALHCQVSSSTLARWKEEDPDFEGFLGGAPPEFEGNQGHKADTFVRRDGQADPLGGKWLLERSNPERWGRPLARRTPSQLGTKNQEPGTASKAPKPNTPEYWDYVEEE